MSKMAPLTVDEVRRIIAANRKGTKPATLFKDSGKEDRPIDFVSSLGDDSIDRFDNKRRKKKKKKKPASSNSKAGSAKGGNSQNNPDRQ